MADIMSVLKAEILRLARKEVRNETESLKKASAHYRSDIAALKRQVAALEKQVDRTEKRASKGNEPAVAEGQESPKFRFSAKRMAAQRKKLGLSAGDMGTLVGVSAQTIYNWEAEQSRPRQQQLAAIAALRKLGKRQIKAKLETPAE